MPESAPRSRKNSLLLIVPVLIVLLPVGFSVVASLSAPGDPARDVFLEMPAPQYKECVRDTAYMRFHHWELLRQTREEVVRYGVREGAGLYECARCHTSRERFCDRCHAATSLYPDCWGCHYYP
jgi:hypothetical protein